MNSLVLPRDAYYLPYVPFVVSILDLPLDSNIFCDISCDARSDYLSFTVGNSVDFRIKALVAAAKKLFPNLQINDRLIVDLIGGSK